MNLIVTDASRDIHDFIAKIFNVVSTRNPGLLYFHALDRVGCMQIYHRLSKSITTDKYVLKNNMDTIENINIDNKDINL